MTDLAKLVVKLEAESSKLTSELEKANGRLKKWEQSTGKSVDFVKNAFIGLAGAYSVRELARFVNKSMESIDTIGKMARTYGIATEELSGFRLAAELGDASLEQFAKAAKNVSQVTYDYLVKNTGEGKEAFQALGVTQAQLKPIMNDTTKLIGLVADKLDGMQSGAVKTALATKLLGARQVDLLPALEGGTKQLEAYKNEAEQLGISFSAIDASKVEAANDSFTRMKLAMEGIGNKIAIELAPYLEAIITYFVNIAKESGGMQKYVSNSLDNIIRAVGFVADSFRGLQAVFKVIQIAAIETWVGISTLSTKTAEWVENKVNRIVSVIDLIISYTSKLSGISVPTIGMIDLGAEEERKNLEELETTLLRVQSELYELITMPMPSTSIKQWAKDVEYNAQTAAVKLQKARDSIAAPELTDTSLGESLDKYRQHYADKIEDLETYLMDEFEKEKQAYQKRSEMIDQAVAYNTISEQRGQELQEKLLQDHLSRMYEMQSVYKTAEQKLWESGWQGKIQVASGILGDLSALMITKNRQMFEIGKKAAIAQAIIDTIAAAQSAYKAMAGIPVVGPALAVAAAAAATAAGYARVQAIKSTSFDSGGGRSVRSGGVSVGGGQPVEAGTQSRDIRVTVDFAGKGSMNTQQLEQFAKDLAKHIKDGGTNPVAA